jgi:hydrogenase maturation protease
VTRSVVLGIGNVLLTDDGAGVHAARRVEVMLHHRADVRIIDGGTLSFTLAPLIADAERLIVIDSADLQAPPGTMRVFLGTHLDAFLGKPKLTVHEVSLVDLLDIARLTDAVPPQRALVAVQPRTIDWGETLSAELESALAAIVAKVIDLLDNWPAEFDQAHSSATAAATCP